MKRIGLILAAFLLVLCSWTTQIPASAQTETPAVYQVEYRETLFTVDLDAMTISYDDVVCRFEIPGGTSFLVTYPDGSTYLWEQTGFNGEASWSDDYDPNRYVPGETLWAVLGRQSSTAGENGWSDLVAWVFIIIGVLNAAAPKVWWKLCYGWWSKEKEPAKTMLVSGRVIGFAAAVIGVMILFA